MELVGRKMSVELCRTLEGLLDDARKGECFAIVACVDYGSKYRTVFAGSTASVAEEVGMMQIAMWDRLKPRDE